VCKNAPLGFLVRQPLEDKRASNDQTKNCYGRSSEKIMPEENETDGMRWVRSALRKEKAYACLFRQMLHSFSGIGSSSGS
jgi:hypothetical protein